jgi:hypothetical protein
MNAVEEIKAAQAAELVEEDGDPVEFEFAPPLSAEKIDALARERGVSPPRELQQVLAYTAGIDGVLEGIDFTGENGGAEADEVFPFGWPIAIDGFGNHWLVDATPEDADTAPVFFVCHDPPVVLYQSPSLAHFLHETFQMYVPPHRSLVDDVHDDRPFNVWGTNPGVIECPTARAGDDDELRAFADALDDRFLIVDLRSPDVGMGFSWGRFGPLTELRRHGDRRLFAYAQPPKKLGLFARLRRSG